MIRRILLFLTALTALALLPLASGCNDTTEPEPVQQTQDPPENDNQPNANTHIVSQAIVGDTAMDTSFWHMDGDAAHGYACTGPFDRVLEARRLSAGGTTQWHEPLVYQPRNVLSVDNDRVTGTVVVGARDTDGDGLRDQGAVTLVDAAGAVLDELTVEDAGFPLWLNSVEAVSDSLFLCVGGVEIAETYQPLVCSLLLDADGALQVLGYHVIEGLPGGWFSDLEQREVVHDVQTGETTVQCFVDGLDVAESAARILVNSLRVPMHDPAGTEVLWTSHVVGYTGLDAYLTTGHSICVGTNGKVYVSGYTAVNKDPAPNNGGYWKAGLVACLAAGGDAEWTQRVVLSEFSDRYYGVRANADGVYAVGMYSSYNRNDRHFAYGLLTRFDPATGTVDYHMTIGQATCRSCLYGLEVEGTIATAAGKTHDREDGANQGWFVNLNLASPPAELSAVKRRGAVVDAAEDGEASVRTSGR